MTTTPTSGAADLASRLRNACTSVRSKSYPLADLIPLMQQAADALASVPAQPVETAESHADASVRWQPSQQWQCRLRGTDEWSDLPKTEVPMWLAHIEYRRHPGCRRSAAAQAVVPSGWNIVPTEPTQAMLDAVVTSMDDFLLDKEAEKRYREDWAAMLAAAQAQPVAEQGAAYAALPASSYAGRVYEEGFLIGTCRLYTADQLRAFADATHALRASNGQAPAQTGNSVSAQADRVQEDAARYRALRDEANQLHEDDISVSDSSFTTYFGSDLDEAVDALVKRAARKQGANNDR